LNLDAVRTQAIDRPLANAVANAEKEVPMRNSRQLLSGLLCCVLVVVLAPDAIAGGTVSVCNEVNLKLAIAGGGDVTITCLDPIILTSTIQIFTNVRIFGRPDPTFWGPRISGDGKIQVMAVRAGARVLLDHLVIDGGRAGVEGGAIFNDGRLLVIKSLILDNSAPSGGAIANHGDLWLSECQVSLNSANTGGAIANAGTADIDFSGIVLNDTSGDGGAIYNSGVLRVVASDISNNSIHGVFSLAAGGAIFNKSGGDLRVLTTTFRANNGGEGGALANRGRAVVNNSLFWLNFANFGGAVHNSSPDRQPSATFDARNSTFASNGAAAPGVLSNGGTGRVTLDYTTFADNRGSIQNDGGTVTIKNSILARPTPAPLGPRPVNCQGIGVIDAGYNLDDDGSCSFSTRNHSLSHTPAELDILRYNGGWTQTIALLADSPAIDKIPVGVGGCGPGASDQRFVPRPQARACDIGAYEVNPPLPPPDGACNGSYTGHFIGNLFVAPGSTCQFLSGSIRGSVHVDGGTLILGNVTVDGSVEITSGALSLAPFTIITKNLQIHHLAGGLEENSICGATIQGHVEVHDNAAAITIGADPLGVTGPTPSSFCAGNTVGGNLHVHNNSAPLQVVGNTVSGHLDVHSNSAPIEVIDNAVRGKLFCHGNATIQGGPNVGSANARGQCYQNPSP